MAISCSTLYEDIANELGTGVGTGRLANSFIRAVNRTLGELAINADSAGVFQPIESTDAVINLNAKYEFIVYSGVVYNMIRSGVRPSDPRVANVVYEDSRIRWNDAKGQYMMDVDNLAQANGVAIMGLGIDRSDS